MSTIRVNVDELDEKGNELIHCSEEISQIVERTGQLKDQMMDIWEGSASQAFDQLYMEMKPKMDEFVTLVCNMGLQTKKVAENMSSTDSTIAKQIRSNR